jgi:hypothetical protein
VLDAAIVPTKKTFPPRTGIIILGTSLGLALATTWIVAMAGWEKMDESDLRKEFAKEVLTEVRANLPGFSRNGTSGSSNGHRSWVWWKKTERPSDADHEGGKIDAP